MDKNQMNKKARTTKDKKKKRYRFRVRRLKKLLIIIAVVTLIVIFARSSFFTVENISVSGNKKYQTNEIILRSGLVTGGNVFKMLGEKPKNLFSLGFKDREIAVSESMPYIKAISIKPSLPKSIKIKVSERTPFCILETKGTSILIDKEGYALENLKDQKDKYFKILGISLDSYKIGYEVQFKNKDLLTDLLAFCDAINKNDKDFKLKLYDKLTAVDLSEPNTITAVFENRVTVRFGDMEEIERKIEFFRQLFVNNITAKQKGTLDFTKGNDPYFTPAG
jgi:cell division protein FtsQ